MCFAKITVVGLIALIFGSGCRVFVSVDITNMLDDDVNVHSMQTGQKISVRKQETGRLVHYYGDILVVDGRGNGAVYRGVDVAQRDMDSRYYGKYRNLFGPDRRDIKLLLENDGRLFVLLPGRRRVDESIGQPPGYPKRGNDVDPTMLLNSRKADPVILP